MTENDVTEKFEGDRQLARMWIFFLLHNHCIEKAMNIDGDYVYSLTEKGKEWIERYKHDYDSRQ